MLIPVSLKDEKTDFLIFQLLAINSCLYFTRKWIVSSTEIPKAMLKTKMVEGFIGIFKNPITPAVKRRGRIFGTNEIMTILYDLNKYVIIREISIIAKKREISKFFIKNLVPFKYPSVFPVRVTSNLSFGKYSSIPFSKLSSMPSITSVSISPIIVVILAI